MSPVYLRAMVTRYVTLFTERSGSTYLATLLASHPDINAKREEFAHLLQRGIDGAGQLQWAREFWCPPLLGNHKAIGFKTKIVDILDPDGFAALLTELKVKIVQLQRRNLVKAVVSTMNAKRLHDASGNWNLMKESDRLPGFEVDPVEFEKLLQERIRWDTELEEYAARLDLPRLSLYYEDLLQDEKAFLLKLFDFIGVAPKPVQGKTLKNTKDDLREVVVNFDDLRGRYEGTPYKAMFDEVID
jgi:LPS sulfotransferase NodH